MAFTKTTFVKLQQSVLESMERLGNKPVEVNNVNLTSVFFEYEPIVDDDDKVVILRFCLDTDTGLWYYEDCKKQSKLGKLIRKSTPKDCEKPTDAELVAFVERNQPKKYWMYVTDDLMALHYRTFEQERGVHSCMSYPPSYYGQEGIEGLLHPVDCYNRTPNARLALFAKKHHKDWKPGEYPFYIRFIFNSDTKCYDKTYGETILTLSSLGFSNKYPNGLKLNKVYNDCGELMMPYIDRENRAREDEDYLVADESGELEGVHDTGLAELTGDTCADCGERFDPDQEGIYVDGHGCVCGCCGSSYVYIYNWGINVSKDDCTWSNYLEEYVPDESMVETEDGEVVWDDCDDLVEVDGGYYLIKSISIDYCDYNCKYILTEDAIKTPDGYMTIHKDSLDDWKKDNDWQDEEEEE